MSKRELTSIHSTKPHWKNCEICDENEDMDCTKWYEFIWTNQNGHKIIGCCLECCKHTGKVVGWLNYEDRYKPYVGKW